MSETKREISVLLDEDLLVEFEAAGLSLSVQLNSALREEVERLRREQSLTLFLDQLDADHKPVSEDLVDKYTQLLES
ncbi:MAG: type II toxin-antitoxin system CcdA family antitoxin [Acidobacteriota bacterium]